MPRGNFLVATSVTSSSVSSQSGFPLVVIELLSRYLFFSISFVDVVREEKCFLMLPEGDDWVLSDVFHM